MSSACPTLPVTVAVPPPRLSTSLSSVVVPLAMLTVEAWAIAALMPCTVASPEASSMVVVPSATFTRPAALAGMPLTVAPPEKPVQSPSRFRSTSMPLIDGAAGSDGVGADLAGDHRRGEIVGDQRIDGDGLRLQIAARDRGGRRLDGDVGRHRRSSRRRSCRARRLRPFPAPARRAGRYRAGRARSCRPARRLSSSARSPEILFLPSDSSKPVDGALAVRRRQHRAALQGLSRDIAGQLHIGRRVGGIGLAGGGELQPGDLARRHQQPIAVDRQRQIRRHGSAPVH